MSDWQNLGPADRPLEDVWLEHCEAELRSGLADNDFTASEIESLMPQAISHLREHYRSLNAPRH